MKKLNFSIAFFAIAFFCLWTTEDVQAQTKKVAIDLQNKRFIGGVSNLSRARYFNMHGSYLSDEFKTNNIYGEIIDDLDAGRSRAASGPGRRTIQSNGKVTAYPNANRGTTAGQEMFNIWRNRVGITEFDNRKTADLILTDDPKQIFLANGDYAKVGRYASNFIKAAFLGMTPRYYEIMNEPFVKTNEFGNNRDQIITQMSQLHKEIAERIHLEIPGTLVGGYSSAFPQMEAGFPMFNHWNKNQKKFMDITNNSMDFYATHLYDGINGGGQDQRRHGSNIEAIMDLIEAYSHDKYGVVKPHLISEYGKTTKAWIRNNQGIVPPYSQSRDGEIIKSINGMLFQLLEKPDRLLKSVPFIVAKFNWFYNIGNNPNNNPYPWAILRRLGNGQYTYTHLRKFYELWRGVKGYRVLAKTNDPDILARVFVNGRKAYVAIHNMDGNTRTVQLDFLGSSGNSVGGVNIREFFTDNNGTPKLNLRSSSSIPESITVRNDATTILVLDLKSTPEVANTTREDIYYPRKSGNQSTVLRNISANKEYTYNFNGVLTGEGTSVVRVGFGREKNASKRPKVVLNGTVLNTPTDWIGNNQSNRDRWFGVIEIPFSTSLLKSNNTVKVSFPDSGGRISSVLLMGQRKSNGVNPPTGSDIVIEAEDFINTNGTFDDAIAGGPGFGVRKNISNISYVNSRDYVDYNFSVSDPGEYRITYEISTPSDNAQIQSLIDNTSVAIDNVPNNGQWSNYASLIASNTINDLTIGSHTLRILASGTNLWQWNLDKIILTKIGESETDSNEISQEVTLLPIQDAYLQGNKRFNTNVIRIDKNDRTGYLMFDLSSVTGTIKKAKLEFTINEDPGNGNITIHKGDNTQWSEDNISNVNKPETDQLLGSINEYYRIEDKKTIELNTDAINKGLMSLIIQSTSGNDFAFASKENNFDDSGRLVISYIPNKMEGPELSDLHDVTLYPNPTKKNLTLVFNSELKSEYVLQLYDTTGRMLEKFIVQDNNYILNTEKLPKGLYIVFLKGEAQFHKLKFIKE